MYGKTVMIFFSISRTYFRYHKDPNCIGPFPKKYESVEKTLRELRRSKYGKSPKSVHEIADAFENEYVMEGLGKSLYGERERLFNTMQIEQNFSNCIFSSPSSIALIKKYIDTNERFFIMDGTFRITPHGVFTQVLVIYVRFELKVLYFSHINMM